MASGVNNRFESEATLNRVSANADFTLKNSQDGDRNKAGIPQKSIKYTGNYIFMLFR